MITLCCTKKLLDKMAKPCVVQAEAGDDDWYVNLFRLGRKQCIIFTHVASLYSFIVPGARKQDFIKISQVFILELEFQLKRDNFPHERNVELLERFWDIQIGKTVSRSILGSMNDMINCADYLFNTLPQFYGCKPVDEVIRHRRTGKACCGKCYGRKPVEIYFTKT